MAIKTLFEQLVELDAAKTAVLKGQSYRIGNRTMTKVDYAALCAEYDKVFTRYTLEQAASSGSGGIFNKVTFTRPV